MGSEMCIRDRYDWKQLSNSADKRVDSEAKRGSGSELKMRRKDNGYEKADQAY